MSLAFGASGMDNCKIGINQVSKLYIGADIVWEDNRWKDTFYRNGFTTRDYKLHEININTWASVRSTASAFFADRSYLEHPVGGFKRLFAYLGSIGGLTEINPATLARIGDLGATPFRVGGCTYNYFIGTATDGNQRFACMSIANLSVLGYINVSSNPANIATGCVGNTVYATAWQYTSLRDTLFGPDTIGSSLTEVFGGTQASRKFFDGGATRLVAERYDGGKPVELNPQNGALISSSPNSMSDSNYTTGMK